MDITRPLGPIFRKTALPLLSPQPSSTGLTRWVIRETGRHGTHIEIVHKQVCHEKYTYWSSEPRVGYGWLYHVNYTVFVSATKKSDSENGDDVGVDELTETNCACGHENDPEGDEDRTSRAHQRIAHALKPFEASEDLPDGIYWHAAIWVSWDTRKE